VLVELTKKASAESFANPAAPTTKSLPVTSLAGMFFCPVIVAAVGAHHEPPCQMHKGQLGAAKAASLPT
jgi:hypothetical protein